MTTTAAPVANVTPPKKMGDRLLAARIFREIRPHRAMLGVALALYLPQTALSVLQPLFIGRAVDLGFRAKNLDQILLWTLCYVGAVVGGALVSGRQLFMMQRLGQEAVRRLRVKLFQKIQRLPMAYFDRVPLGRIMTRVTNDTESVAEVFSSGAVSIIGDFLFLGGTLIMLVAVDAKLSLSTLIVLPPLVLGVQWFRKRARVAFGRVRSALSTMNASIQELLSGMSIVQLFGQKQRVFARFEEENRAYMLANREAIALDAGVYAFVDAMGTIATAAALAAGFYLSGTTSLHDGLSLGVLVTFVEALGRFFGPIRELSNKTTLFQSAFVAAERIVELEEEPETITTPSSPKPATFARRIVFDDVRFRYGDGPEVLKGLSLTVNKGEHVAVVGHTGAGKSTIVKLLPRMYDVTGGSITIDDVDIREMDPVALRRLTAAVPQDVFLFAGTIGHNLRFGAPDASDARLWEAIRACQAEPIVEKHGGLAGVVSERGQNLSLGERQILALVRALLSDPPVLILDEATASIDRQTERRLQAATDTLLQGRTAILVAHRLATIERCDRIVVVHQGVVVEQGTHAELMTLQGRYATFVDLQRRSGG